MRGAKLYIGVIKLGLLCWVAVQAEDVTVTLEADRDAVVYEENGDWSNGSGEMMVGRTMGKKGELTRRILIGFPVEELPANAVVKEVVFTLTVDTTKGGPNWAEPGLNGPEGIELYRLEGSWVEPLTDGSGQGSPALDGDVTWSHRVYPDVPWSVPGGDVASILSGYEIFEGGDDELVFDGMGLVEDVQGWVDGTFSNDGWILIGNPDAVGKTIHFYTHDISVARVRPKLEITYELAAGVTFEFLLDAPGGVVSAAGGEYELEVRPSDAGAQWSAELADAAWVSLENEGDVITGAGVLELSFEPNYLLEERSFLLTVGESTFEVLQEAGPVSPFGGTPGVRDVFAGLIDDSGFPWVWFLEFGWLYVVGAGEDAFWGHAIFPGGVDWLWMDAQSHPFVYFSNRAGWLYSMGEGWYYDFGTEEAFFVGLSRE